MKTIIKFFVFASFIINLSACDNDSTGEDIESSTIPVILSAEAKPGSVTLSWNNTSANSYDLYYSTAPDCESIANQ